MSTEPINTLTLDTLVEAVDNPNSMEPEQFGMLVEAIRRVGFLQPALVRALPGGKYEIIDGHHRVRAAREVGLASVPCVVLDESADENKAIALRIGMNRLRGELNLASVAKSMDTLTGNGWSLADLTITGFSGDEVADLLSSLRTPEDDVLGQKIKAPDALDAEEVPTKPYVLEITFSKRDDYKTARAGLKRAAGKKGDLAAGLLRLLGEK